MPTLTLPYSYPKGFGERPFLGSVYLELLTEDFLLSSEKLKKCEPKASRLQQDRELAERPRPQDPDDAQGSSSSLVFSSYYSVLWTLTFPSHPSQFLSFINKSPDEYVQ